MNNTRNTLLSFHSQNKTKTKLVSFSNLLDITYLSNHQNINGEFIIYNIPIGYYGVFINSELYTFIVKYNITGNDYVYIKTGSTAKSYIQLSYFVIDGKKIYFKMYKNYDFVVYDKNGNNISNQINSTTINTIDFSNHKIRLLNTVNASIDSIIMNGRSNLIYANGTTQQSPYSPGELTSVSNIKISTSNETDINITDIALKNNIKSLPSGVKDLLIIDSYNQEAYIAFRIGRIILTGAEDWKLIKYTDKYAIFFFKQDFVHVGEDDTSVICNYFPSIGCTRMLNNDEIPYAISNSNDSNNKGFYIRIPLELIEFPEVVRFRRFISNCFKTNPVIIEYLLNETRYKTVLLDEFHIKQFNPYTDISINYNTEFSVFSRVLSYKDLSQIRSHSVLQFRLQIN